MWLHLRAKQITLYNIILFQDFIVKISTKKFQMNYETKTHLYYYLIIVRRFPGSWGLPWWLSGQVGEIIPQEMFSVKEGENMENG